MSGVVRELHFVSSIVLVLVLVFFAATGFMAQHRDAFHPRVDRADLADRVDLRGRCDPERLADEAGTTPDAVEVHAELLIVDDASGARRACRRGTEGQFVGTVSTWPSGVDRDVDALRTSLEHGTSRRLEPAGTDPTLFRSATVWAETTYEVDVERGRLVTWVRHLPLAYSLIELHRGRGTTEVLVDVTAALTVVVAVTGLLHGLRYPGRRRRVLVALVIASALLLTGLLAG